MPQQQFDLFVSEFTYLEDRIKANDIEQVKDTLFYCYQDFYFDMFSDKHISYEDVYNNYDTYIKCYYEWYNIIYNWLLNVTKDYTYHGGFSNLFDMNTFDDNKVLAINLPYYPPKTDTYTLNAGSNSNTNDDKVDINILNNFLTDVNYLSTTEFNTMEDLNNAFLKATNAFKKVNAKTAYSSDTAKEQYLKGIDHFNKSLSIFADEPTITAKPLKALPLPTEDKKNNNDLTSYTGTYNKQTLKVLNDKGYLNLYTDEGRLW